MRTWQKLSRQRVHKTSISIRLMHQISIRWWLFALWTTKKENSTLKSIGVSPVNISGVAQHSHALNTKAKSKKVLNVYKENISAAYNVSNIEIEEPPPIYDRDTKNKSEVLDRLHAAMKLL